MQNPYKKLARKFVTSIMKILFQQRNKLRNFCVLFPVTQSNFSNMMYYYCIINKRYKNCDYTCAKSNNLEVENLFNLVVKLDGPDEVLSLVKNFVKQTSHRRVLLVLNDMCFDSAKSPNSAPVITARLPEEMPKKGMMFDMYENKIAKLRITQRNSLVKHYQPCLHTFMFLDIGKQESKTRSRIVDRMENCTSLDAFICLRKNIEPLKCIQETVEDLEPHYKMLRRKKINVQSRSLENLIQKSALPMDKFGVKLSTTKSYTTINSRVEEQIKTAKSLMYDDHSPSQCKCIHTNLADCPCNRTSKSLSQNCPCRRSNLTSCPCRTRLAENACPCVHTNISECPCRGWTARTIPKFTTF